ncbi:MAG: peptidoglycan DD-metalloendopeptidase family protein [Candidatus Magasanikbacteria bacterium]|nr:peptidoglycan DD-metalloendopeptidase family protein [Candidatus Magasanikbacteria bacterium]
MHKHFLLIILVLAIIGTVFYVKKGSSEGVEQVNRTVEETQTPPEPKINISTHTIEEQETFATVLEDFGIGYSQMLEILDSASSTYDLTRIRVGQPMRLAVDTNRAIKYLEYELSKENYIHIEFLTDGNYRVTQKQIQYETQIIRQAGTISNSLYLDGLATNIPEGVIIEYANIFAWTIDFSVQVQPGDSFEILYEKRSRDGKDAGYGKILAGKFVNSGRVYDAYLFEDAEGKTAYYSAQGESLQKQFLKAPLEFRRISSGYAYARFDPVLHRNLPHLAIDYAAALGTPVMAVGDGTVEFAGWNNQGFGNFVSIHHNETYTTQYAHMSGFGSGIKKGVSVVQGQVIGYVGSTGNSTGPHLHYQIKKNGTLVNPLQLELPAGDAISENKKSEFEQIVAKYDEQLNEY